MSKDVTLTPDEYDGALPGSSWLIQRRFEAEFSAEEQNASSVVGKVPETPGTGLDRLDPTIESLAAAIADRVAEPGQNIVQT